MIDLYYTPTPNGCLGGLCPVPGQVSHFVNFLQNNSNYHKVV